MSKKEIIYFDNNSTTLICDKSINAVNTWISSYNPSSESRVSKPIKLMIENTIHEILSHCSVSVATHTLLFTSGATESNCFIIKSCSRAYKKKLMEKVNSIILPHIIASSLEHRSIIDCLHDMEEKKEIEVTYINPTLYGTIESSEVEKAIKPNTCLITVMYANNELPVINNVAKIGAIANKNRIPFHSDCVQVFGKYPINLETTKIDALSASGHKFYAPKGVGIIIIKNELIEGYNLTSEICGSQQNGLRGGTENAAYIAAFNAALKYAFNSRTKKNEHLHMLRQRLINKLELHYLFGKYENYYNNEKPINSLELVLLGPPKDKDAFILPNTVLLSISKYKGKPFCNILLKSDLDNRNIIISIGSACNASSSKASHVLTSINAPPIIKRGTIRISFGDNNTFKEIDMFIDIFNTCVEKQCNDITIPRPVSNVDEPKKPINEPKKPINESTKK